MSFIDTTYFVRDINIPVSSNAALNTALLESITTYEEEALKLLLGYKLWKEMNTALDAVVEADPLAEPPVEAVALATKWDKFINGSEFTFELNGETVTEYWSGLKNTSKKSFLANYVYFMYRRNNESLFNGTSETVAVSENSKNVSPRSKLVNAWNGFVEMYGDSEYCFPENPVSNIAYQHINDKPSAYNFLLANLSDYSDWKFTPQDKINAWGL